MKKKIIATLSLSLALALGGALAAPAITASASAKSNPIVTDDFGDDTYKNSYNTAKWEKYGDEAGAIKQASTGGVGARLMFKGDANADNIFVVSKEKYKLKSVTFDAYYDEGFGINWSALNFTQTKNNTESMYNVPLLLRANQCAVNQATVTANNLTSIASVLGENKWLSYKYEITGANTFNLYVTAQGEEFPETPALSAAASNDKIYNDAYISFVVSGLNAGTTYSVDNVVIETETETITENFESLDSLKFEIVRKDTSKVTRALVYSPDALTFENAAKGARLVAKNAVTPDESILKDYEVIKAEFNLGVTTGGVAFTYALPQMASEVSSDGVYEYEMTATEGILRRYNSAGEAVEIGRNVFTAVNSEEGARFEISINKNGTMSVYENGELVKDSEGAEVVYGIEAYAGYVAFNATAESTQAKLDDVVIKASTYFVPVTKSLTNNFSTDYVGGEDTRDFFMTSEPSNSLVIENGELCFNGCSDRTFFGSCYEYDNFILDYKLTNIYVGTDEVEDMDKTGVGRWFGLDIGRPNYDTSYYGQNLMFYFNIVAAEGTETTTLNTYVTSGITVPETLKIDKTAIPMSLFRDISYDGVTKTADGIEAGDAVCVRWVAEDNVLKLYMKKASDLQFTQYATITGMETNGYVALCCTGFTHLHLDDFSIANTSAVYECASNEAPEKEIIEVEPEYDYNKYIETGTFKEELNYLENMNTASGCQASVGLAVLPVLTAGAVGYFVFRKKEDK